MAPDRDAAAIPSPPDSPRARRTYQELLAATERLLARGGYPAATTTAVADEAGVSVGTVYRYAADRDALLAALFADRLDALLERIEAVLSVEVLLDDGLEAVVDRALDAVLAGYRDHAAAFRAALVQLPAAPAVAAVYWDRHERGAQVAATFLRRAQRAGAVRDDESPEVLAEALLVVVQGLNNPVLLGAGGARGARLRALVGSAVRGLLRAERGS